MELVGLTDIADLLGMTRAGADKLVKRESTFPVPVGALTGRTRAWKRNEVVQWAKEQGRPLFAKTTPEELAQFTLVGSKAEQGSYVAAVWMLKAAAFGNGRYAGEVPRSPRAIHEMAFEIVRATHPNFRIEPTDWLDKLEN